MRARNNENSILSEVETIQIKKGIWRTYDATDGLPGEPHCLLQDRKGYLWLGTSAGLCRYDGTIWIGHSATLSRFDPRRGTGLEFIEPIDGIPDARIQRLLEDSQGKLWMGERNGDGLSCWDGNKLITYTQKNGLPSDDIASLVEDDEGQIIYGFFRAFRDRALWLCLINTKLRSCRTCNIVGYGQFPCCFLTVDGNF